MAKMIMAMLALVVGLTFASGTFVRAAEEMAPAPAAPAAPAEETKPAGEMKGEMKGEKKPETRAEKRAEKKAAKKAAKKKDKK